MKKYKKVLAVLLTGMMTFTLSACGGGNASQEEAEQEVTEAEQEVTEAEQEVTEAEQEVTEAESEQSGSQVNLRMIFWDSNQEPGLVAMAEGFMKQHENISVSVETVPWDEYWMKLQAAAQGQNMPDIVVMHPDEVENYAEGGMLMDLTDILEGDIANKSNFPDYVVEDFAVDGKLYGIPKDIGTVGLFYNKDLFDAAGVEYPNSDWTWDDLMAAAEKLTDPEAGIYGLNAPNEAQNFYWNLVWQNGGDVWDKENNRCTFDDPATIEAMEYAVSFIEKGYSPTPAEFANLSEHQYFESGKSAMNFAGSWMLTEYQNVDGLHFGVAELPKGKERAAICSGMAFSVAASTQYPDEARLLAEYLGSQEGQTIQAESGVAIPAYKGTQQPWVDMFTDFDASPFVKVEEYGHTSPGLSTSTNEASAIINEYMPRIFLLEIPVADGLKTITESINSAIQ